MHIATLGAESTLSAAASECAADQAQFWPYHDQVYLNQATNRDTLSTEFLINLASQLNLDTALFETCLTSGQYDAIVKAESDLGNEVGVRATPGFIINGQVIMGAQPYEAFAHAIDTELELRGLSKDIPAEIEGLVTFPAEPVPDEVLDGQWQNCGIYDEPLNLDNILAAMAHGAVWVGYRPDLSSDSIETLRELVRQAQGQRDEPMIILAPEPSFGDTIIATAWRVQLAVPDANDPRLKQFLTQFQASSYTPQLEEPCTGGVGQPLE